MSLIGYAPPPPGDDGRTGGALTGGPPSKYRSMESSKGAKRRSPLRCTRHVRSESAGGGRCRRARLAAIEAAFALGLIAKTEPTVVRGDLDRLAATLIRLGGFGA